MHRDLYLMPYSKAADEAIRKGRRERNEAVHRLLAGPFHKLTGRYRAGSEQRLPPNAATPSMLY